MYVHVRVLVCVSPCFKNLKCIGVYDEILELIADLELIAYFELIANLELIADLVLITDL